MKPLHLFSYIFLVGWVICTASFADAQVSFTQHEDTLSIHIGTVTVAEYVYSDSALPRPYFKQLRTRDGIVVSRSYPPDPVLDAENNDHSTFHPGAWLAFGDVNGTDFWRNKARVRNLSISKSISSDDRTGEFEVHNAYETSAGIVLFEERCRYSISLEKYGYLLRATSTFTSASGDIVFGDQEEMGFGVRLATGLRVRGGNGSLRNSEGGSNESGTWGRPAEWLAGYGTANGRGVGMMVLAAPDNFRKSWFHSRNYGLIVANPFGKKAMTGPGNPAVQHDTTTVRKGDSLTLDFGIYVFNYTAKREPAFADMHQHYLKRLENR